MLSLYQSLRQEILQADSLNYQIIGVTVAATAAVTTAAVAQSDPFNRIIILLGVYMLTLPAYLLLFGNRRRTWRISTFMRTCIEPELQWVKWEAALDMQRRRRGDRRAGSRADLGSSLVSKNEWRITTLLAASATGFAVVIGAIQLNLNALPKVGVIIGLITLFALYALLTRSLEKRIKRLGQIEDGMNDWWAELRPLLYVSDDATPAA